jgi:predicted negative regulator of RcsB-dependent stress response
MENKENKGLNLIENADALKKEIFKVEDVFTKNKSIFTYIGGAVVALVAAYFAYNYYKSGQEKEAQAAMFDAVYSFEADSLNKALKGQGGNMGLNSIADDYSGTAAGKLASLYAGVALMNQNKFSEAIEKLEAFDANDQVLQAKTYCLIGDCYLETGKNDDAINYYQKAVNQKPNKIATPGYMMKLAGAFVEAKKNKDALGVYTEIAEKYAASTEAVMAKKYKSRIETELGE